MQRWLRKKSADNDSDMKDGSLLQRFSYRIKSKQVPGSFASEELTILHHEMFHLDEKQLVPPSSISRRSPSTLGGNRDLLPDDPTVEESIECVFARQLEVYQYGLVDESLPDESIPERMPRMPDKATLEKMDHEFIQQPSFCGLFTETDPMQGEDEYVGDGPPQLQNTAAIPRKNVKAGKLTYLGTMNGTGPGNGKGRKNKTDLWIKYDDVTQPETPKTPNEGAVVKTICNACKAGINTSPSIDTKKWPQAPLFLRPTPSSGTVIRGVRRAASLTNTDEEIPSFSPQWTKFFNPSLTSSSAVDRNVLFCPQCCCIPINNGNETSDDALVIDFESPIFIGVMLVRIRGSVGTTSHPYDDSIGYFSGMQRQYQAVIRGRFKRDNVPMTECVTGQIFRRPFDKSPPFILRILTFFAPLLQAKLDGAYPYFLSPLGSTPQVVTVDRMNKKFEDVISNVSIATHLEEPTTDDRRLIAVTSSAGSSSSAIARAKARKKAFDALCISKEKTLTFDKDKIYTFEFLQHLLDYNTFEINLGSVLGKMKLKDSIGGQPALIMSAHQRPLREGENVDSCFSNVVSGYALDVLWSFDIWHEGMVKSK